MILAFTSLAAALESASAETVVTGLGRKAPVAPTAPTMRVGVESAPSADMVDADGWVTFEAYRADVLRRAGVETMRPSPCDWSWLDDLTAADADAA